MSTPTVLLVEDDPRGAVLLGMMLRQCSAPVRLRQVNDGHEAVAYLKGEGCYSNRDSCPLPGLVLLDLHLPGFGGMAVLRWIRKQDWLLGLPVVVFSASDYGQSSNEAMASGADTYMIKGDDSDGLIHLLENTNLQWASKQHRGN